MAGAICAQAQLVKDWHAVETPHFELVSRYDPAKVGALLEDLEWARAVFETNFGLKSRLDRQALILVPDSPYEYEQLSPSKLAGGFYLSAPWRDIIVLKELPDARHALLHEYTHLILRHQGGRWPLWFHEGTAEYYATTAEEQGGKRGSRRGRTEALRRPRKRRLDSHRLPDRSRRGEGAHHGGRHRAVLRAGLAAG